MENIWVVSILIWFGVGAGQLLFRFGKPLAHQLFKRHLAATPVSVDKDYDHSTLENDDATT